jgi:hypothetical protein
MGKWRYGSTPGHFTTGESAPGTHWTGSWVGPRAGLDTVAKGYNPCPCQESNPGCRAPSLVAILTELPRFPLMAYLNIILPSTPWFPKSSLPFRLRIFHLSWRATCPVHLVLLLYGQNFTVQFLQRDGSKAHYKNVRSNCT